MPHPLWMQPPILGLGTRPSPNEQPDQPHLIWPWNLPIKDSIGFELEEVLRHKKGKACQMVKYLFDANTERWCFGKATTALGDFRDMVLWVNPSIDLTLKKSMFL